MAMRGWEWRVRVQRQHLVQRIDVSERPARLLAAQCVDFWE